MILLGETSLADLFQGIVKCSKLYYLIQFALLKFEIYVVLQCHFECRKKLALKFYNH